MNRYAISVAVLAVTGSVCAQAVQWTEAEGGNGHWYERIAFDADAGDTFDSIRADAVSRGADLASIHSVDQDNFVANIAQGVLGQGVILGTFVASSIPCSFAWTDGSEFGAYASNFGQPPWASSQPDCEDENTDGQPIGYYADGWHDLLMQDIAGAMFEWSADCNDDGIVDYGQILDGTYADDDGNGVPDCCDAGTLCVVEITVDDDLMDLPDADFTSIQEAVDAASDGAVIIVAPGTYLPEPEADYLVEVGAKQIQIMALNSNQPPVLDANGNRGFVRLSGHHDAGTRIDGLVMTGHSWTDGLTYGPDWIRVESGSGEGATIANCQFLDNVTGHGIRANWHLTLEGCLFSGNQLPTWDNGDYSGYLIYFNYHASTVRNCVFDGNHTSDAMFFAFANTPTYEDCVFKGNTFDETPIDEPGFMVARSGHQIINNCEFMNNQGQSCVINSGDVGNSYFCGNSWGTGPCGSWTDLGGNTFSDDPCFLDCNGNDVPDDEDIANGFSQDCNTNSIPDECDLADGTSSDCNANSIPDECESLADCDGDGTSDACEILDGALDMNPADGVPDECQGLPLGACCHGGGCVMSTFEYCFAAEGSYAGDGISCADAGCSADCPADVFEDGVIDINDLLIVLSEFGSVCP